MIKDFILTALGITAIALFITAIYFGAVEIYLLPPECNGYFFNLPEHCKP